MARMSVRLKGVRLVVFDSLCRLVLVVLPVEGSGMVAEGICRGSTPHEERGVADRFRMGGLWVILSGRCCRG